MASLVVANFLVPQSFFLTTICLGLATVLLNLQDGKCYSLFCKFYHYMNRKVLYF